MPDKPALYGCGSVQADAGGAAVPPGSFFADFPAGTFFSVVLSGVQL